MKNRILIMSVIVSCGLGKSTLAQSGKNSNNAKPKDFLWGIGTAAYQVEGAYQADGKGESNWDYYANELGLTKYTIGEKQTGNIAINMYDRKQYLQDIKLMKQLGVNTYRFSISWSRIIPQGIGQVNEKAVAHYKLLIKDLKAAGIAPFVTLYHFDMPQALVLKGGWANRASVEWYRAYAGLIFKEFGKEVKHFATFNETTMEFFVADFNINPGQSKESANIRYAMEINKVHHELLASAIAIKDYHQLNLVGKIGITFNLAPCIPFDPSNPKDVAAAPIYVVRTCTKHLPNT
jgi:beta-glucosidase